MPFDFTLNATEDYQAYGVSFKGVNLTYDTDDSIMFYFKGEF